MAVIAGAAGFGTGMVAGSHAYVGSASAALSEAPPSDIDLSPVWRAWRVIDEKFVPASVATTSDGKAPEPVSEEERVWGMIQGLAGSLNDPYSYFLPPVEQKQFQEDMSGAFEGVGMEIAIRDQILTVVSPLRSSPAERAGIKAGDRIIKIGDTETRGMDISTAVNTIRGPKGSTVTLTIVREGVNEPLEISIVRDVINMPVVTSTLRDDGIFVIELANFTANSPALFRSALREFVESGSTKLVLDLRGNPGGYLDAAVDMASWFLPSGSAVVTEDYAGNRDNIVHRSRGYNVFTDNLKMVILVDKGSASASEILALALRSYGKATLVGATTFGKGSVQELVDITSDTALKLTVARWVGPNGEPIPHSGIVPDVEVAITDENVQAGEDPQMDKAIEILQGE
jgi:carboxyl-terminal processing protease